MTKPLTPIQTRIFEFVRSHIMSNGRPPTLREIQAEFDYASPHTPQFHVRNLVKAGYLIQEKGHRGLRLAEAEYANDEQTVAGVRLVGMVAAGSPIEAIEQHDQRLNLNGFSDEDHFALKVRGESMIEECITDGDHVIVRRQTTCTDGDLVVARIGEEATLKRFFHDPEKQRVTLEPANSSMQPIHYRATDVQVEGVVVGVVRLMK